MTERSVKDRTLQPVCSISDLFLSLDKMKHMSPRTKEDNEKIRSLRKQEIISAAFELFALRGYHRTSISEIAKKAKVSKGLIYNYFNSKEDLLKEVVLNSYKQASDALYEKMQEEIQKENNNDVLKKVIELFFEMMKEKAHIWKLSISLSMQVSDMPEINKIMYRIFSEAFLRISYLLNPYNIKKVETDARIIAATLDGIALHYYVMDKNYDLETVKQKLIENITNLINNNKP